MRCSGCEEQVWFFTCNCGSKVIFDSLGGVWPEHDCETSWTRNLKRTIDVTGRITVELKPGITISRPPDFSAPDVLDLVERVARNSKPPPIKAVMPKSRHDRELIGVVREWNCTVDPCAKLAVEPTVLGIAMLGPVGARPVGTITLHVVDEDAPESLLSFTFWAPSEIIQGAQVKRERTVMVTLEAIKIPPAKYVWHCRELTVLG